MVLLFIRQQDNGPERNANLMPEGFSRQEPPQMEMLPGKKVVVFAPARFWKMLPMKRRKTMNGGIVRGLPLLVY